MQKRIWLVLAAIVLVFSLKPVESSAAKQKDVDALIASALDSYAKTQESTGMESLNGYCGKMVSHQLVHMGINEGLVSNHGNMQYDMYAAMRRTSGGYYIGDYPATKYTMKEALNVISAKGTKDVYNILVGFEWTNTEAGGKYGHVCVINGILNGKVYFIESYDTRFAVEGQVNICTIDEFVGMYEKWTTFEGIIHFTKDYGEASLQYGTDLYVHTRFAMSLRSQPTLLGKHDCKVLRTVSAGERLRVTAVVCNAEGELFYRVEEKERTGYIVAQSAVVDRTNGEDLSLEKMTLPEVVPVGERNVLSGVVEAKNGLVGAVEFVVTDREGTVVLRQRTITDSYSVKLSDFNDVLHLGALPHGQYSIDIYAETAASYVQGDMVDTSRVSSLLQSATFWVGEKGTAKTQRVGKTPMPEGWAYQDGKWYCYRDGAPLTGWQTYMGVHYYLKEDGSVTTGWATIDGQERYFSDTGAMNIGWLRTKKGLRYSLSDGCFVTGWQTIGASRYYFTDRGYAKVSGTKTYEGVKYKFQSDGMAVPVN